MKLIKNFENIIGPAERLVVVTGAGVSVDSGIPDFRSCSGLYRDPAVVKMMSLDGFNEDPRAFYRKMSPTWRKIRKARPNAAHAAIAGWETGDRKVTVITQNVDGLHQAAGSSNVLEIHGTLSTVSCQQCLGKYDSALFSGQMSRGLAPRCPVCGEVLRPDFVFFDEYLDDDLWNSAIQAIEDATTVIIAGTSLSLKSTVSLIRAKSKNTPVYRLFKSYFQWLNPLNARFSNESDMIGEASEILPMIA